MRRLLLPLLAVLLVAAAPLTAAQEPDGFLDQNTSTDMNEPAPGTGNDEEPPGPALSIEGPPGIIYYVALLALSLALGGVLFYVVFKQDRNPPPGMK